jgi:anaerobic selenocysteine-containing dehydrogenase
MNTGRRLVHMLADRLGIGTHEDQYAYEASSQGPVTASRAPDHWVKTTCGYCSVGCGMLLGVRDGKAVAAKGDPDHPVNAGALCPKGLSEHLTIEAPGRLHRALLRDTNNLQVPSTVDNAIDQMTLKWQSIVDSYGPESVAILSTGQLLTEEFYTLGKLARLGMGVQHYDGNTTLCMASAVTGYKMSFGSDGPPGCYEDLAVAEVVVLWGANIADNHPLLAPRLTENRAGTIITIDPRITKTTTLADIHIALQPRSDVDLLNGIAHILIRDDLVDHEFIRAHTTGYIEFVTSVAYATPEETAKRCGITIGEIENLASLIGRAKSVCLAWTMGVNHSTQGSETVTLLNTLAAITGNIGKPGSSPFSITGQCNAMGTRETGFTASMPGYRGYDNPAHRAELAELFGIEEDRLPAARGKAYPDIIDGILAGTIKALWVIGTNPIVSFPDRARLETALRNLELLVVQDGFETPTTLIADIVLPAAIWGEKDGTYTNSERRASRARAAVIPPGDARSDFQLFLDIATRWGVREELFSGWNTPEDAFTDWTRVSTGRPCDYSGMTYARIEAVGGIQWPFPATATLAPGANSDSTASGITAPGFTASGTGSSGTVSSGTTSSGITTSGTPRLYTDGVVNTPDGKIVLRPVAPVPMTEPPNAEYPFILNTGRTVEHWHTRTKTGKVAILDKLISEAWIDISRPDALRLGVADGDFVRLASRRGKTEPIRVRTTATLRLGHVFMPFHFAERCANDLTLAEFDPLSREPNYKQCAVSVAAVRK